jgi:hypothetical protein
MGAGAKVTRVALVGALAAGVTAVGTALAAAPAASPGGGLSPASAMALVKTHGYAPMDTSGYDPARTLSVIIGVLATSADGHPQQAFFFHDGRYVGTDTSEPSATEAWVWSTDTTVALQYQLYRPDDPMCCPSGGASTVRFRWTGSGFVPLDRLPSTSWDAPMSRR